MAKLMRAIPEMLFMVKGIFEASRTVGCTLILLTVIVYILAIALRQLSKESQMGSVYFGTVPSAMYTVFMRCGFLDSITVVLDEVSEESIICSILMAFGVMMCALVMLNMLVGVLVEVVS